MTRHARRPGGHAVSVTVTVTVTVMTVLSNLTSSEPQYGPCRGHRPGAAAHNRDPGTMVGVSRRPRRHGVTSHRPGLGPATGTRAVTWQNRSIRVPADGPGSCGTQATAAAVKFRRRRSASDRLPVVTFWH